MQKTNVIDKSSRTFEFLKTNNTGFLNLYCGR